MADFCALCDKKLSIFGSGSLVCANQDVTLCSTCCDKLRPMDNPTRGRYLLEHGKPSNPEAMREFLTAYDARQERLARLEPPTRPCPSCGGNMACKIKDFRIGADGNGGIYLFGGYEQYFVDLYACPDCGKVELYTANFAAVQAREAKLAEQKAAEVTCPTCGTTHSPLIGCPICAMNGASSFRRSKDSSSPHKKDAKLPWEK